VDGRKQTLVYPSGNWLTNTYTARGQVKEIYANGRALATFAYDANGNRLKLALNNGVTNGYTYDNASRLTGLIAKQGVSTVASFSYTYNTINDRTAVAREDGPHGELRLRCARQLTGVSYVIAPRKVFNYDAMGNMNGRTNINTSVTHSPRIT